MPLSTFSHVLLDYPDVLVPVRSGVLVVEAQGVHELVEDAADVAETMAGGAVGRPE